MDMRMEKASLRFDVPCGSCSGRFPVEGDVTLPGSLRETANVLYASALAVRESAEATQGRIMVRGRVIFCVIYTQGEKAEVKSIEATADFTHLCDLPGVMPQAEVEAAVCAEHTTAAVHNGRMTMRTEVCLRAGATCAETVEAAVRFDADNVAQRRQRLEIRRRMAKGAGDALLREEFTLPAELEIQDTLSARASVRMDGATGGEGRIGLSGEMTLEAIHASALPGKPIVITRHTVPVAEAVEVQGEGGDLLEGEIRVKDVAVASQAADGGERILRAEVLLDLSARADRVEAAELLSDAYTLSGEGLRLSRRELQVCCDVRKQQAAESGKAVMLLPEGGKPLRNVLAAFAVPVLKSHTQQGSRMIVEGDLDTTLIYLSDDQLLTAARAEVPFRTAFAMTAAPEDGITLSVENLEAAALTSDRAELRYILRAEVAGTENRAVQLVDGAAAAPAPAVSDDIILYFPQPGEDAWEIGRRYRLRESELRGLNPDMQDPPKPGQGLVIWRRKA